MADEQIIVTDKRGSRNPNTTHEEPPAPLDPQEAERILSEQAARAHQEDLERAEQEAEQREFMTAFLVVVNHDGTVRASAGLDSVGVEDISRRATVADFFSACAQVQNDITTSQTAERVMMVLQNATRHMAAPSSQHPGPFPPGWRG